MHFQENKNRNSYVSKTCGNKIVVRVMGIEPTSHAWEARVLPLNDTRVKAEATLVEDVLFVKKNKKKTPFSV